MNDQSQFTEIDYFQLCGKKLKKRNNAEVKYQIKIILNRLTFLNNNKYM